MFCGSRRAGTGGGAARTAPAHPGAGDEVAQPVEVVAVEAEAAPDRAGREQVEDLGRREPGVGELQQAPGDVQQRVHLPQRPVGEPDRQPVARVAVAARVGVAPKAAETSGAKVSTSGQATRTSRGSSVGSSASRPSTISRSTSTCRCGP